MKLEDAGNLAFVIGCMYLGYRIVFSSPDADSFSASSEPATPDVVYAIQTTKATASVNPDRLASSNLDRLSIIEEIANSTEYDWASAGAVLNYGCPPGRRCSCTEFGCEYGLVTGAVGRNRIDVWIYESAFSSRSQLKYTVLHEIAHVWQVQIRGWDGGWGDFNRWLPRGVDPMEATADCLAKVWGASPVRYSYWNCPSGAEDYMRLIYQASVE